jgi:hypothetical protein
VNRGLVVFVCPHGIGKSRMAAALFEADVVRVGLEGWSARTAAGEEPGAALSGHAVRLLAGTPAEGFLQPGPGVSLGELSRPSEADRVLVIGIDFDPPDGGRVDRSWRLETQGPDEQMRAEISAHVSQLVEELGR